MQLSSKAIVFLLVSFGTQFCKTALNSDIIEIRTYYEEQTCLRKIIRNSASRTIVSNILISSTKPSVKLDSSLSDPISIFAREISYILDLRDARVLGNFYIHLKTGYFEPRSLFIFLVSAIDESFLSQLAKYYIGKVYLINQNLEIYTYRPYKSENVHNPDLTPLYVKACQQLAENITLEPFAYPKKWRNTTLIIYLRNLTPFVILKGIYGFEVNFTSKVAECIGMKLRKIGHSHTFQGIKVNGSYENEGLQLLYQKEVDAVAGGYNGFIFGEPQSGDFDKSVVYYVDDVIVNAPKADVTPHWVRIMNIMTVDAEFASLGTLFIWVVFIRLTYGIKPVTLFKLTAMTLFQNPVHKIVTKHRNIRLALSAWLLGILLLTTVFTVAIQEMFYSTQYEKQIDNERDALNSDLPILLPTEVASLMERFNVSVPRGVRCPQINECILQVCRKKSAIFFVSKMITEYSSRALCTDSVTGELLLHLGRTLRKAHIRMFFAKGFPPFEVFDETLKRLVLHGGFLVRMENVGKFLLGVVDAQNYRNSRFRPNLLNLEKLEFLFVLWAVGLGFSTAIFFAELWIAQRLRRRRKAIVPDYPRKWRNTTMRVYYRSITPYVYGDGNGLEEKILQEVSSYLGMKLEGTLARHTFQGIKINGTYQNKGMQMLMEKKCDVAVGGYHAHLGPFHEDFDTSIIYIIDTIHYVFPKSPLKTNWERIFEIAPRNEKIAFILTTIFWIGFVHFAYGESIANLIEIAFLVTINVVVPTIPTSRYKFRIVLGFWILGTYVLSTVFTAFFQAIFYSQKHTKAMYSIEDLMESDLEILGPHYTLSLYIEKGAKDDLQIYDRMQTCTNRTNCILKVCKDRVAAYLADRISVLFLAFDNCLDSDNGELMIDMGEDLYWFFQQMFFSKGYPAYDAIDRTIKKLWLNGGLKARSERNGKKKFEIALAKSKKNMRSGELSVIEMRFILFFWSGGLCVATAAFFLELCFYKYFKRI
ncbi:uncharacterized protein LOC132700895 [Cylas formicarius]|uniref:uncharacterized protein LOC132700895 n=1 Tax=Cylas formicarius TaxID=197179 RepID=UPI002958CCF1|nr:uncharacterized protein LOC132700895 [Cylas formicarius]